MRLPSISSIPLLKYLSHQEEEEPIVLDGIYYEDASTPSLELPKPLGYKQMNYEPTTAPRPYIVTGPVIGKVTSTTARIMVEVTHMIDLTCTLRPEGGGKPIEKTIFVEAFRPESIYFENLDPSTKYFAFFSLPPIRLLRCSFTTMADNCDLEKKPLSLGLIGGVHHDTKSYSINGITMHKTVRLDHRDKDLFKKLSRSVLSGEIDYLIHVGAGVDIGDFKDTSSYARRALDTLSWRPLDEPAYDEICEILRRAYRDYFNEPFTKQVLANCPNLFALNEKAFGFCFNTSESSHLQHIVALCAYEVHNQYCRSLWDSYDRSFDLEDLKTRELGSHHTHDLGDLGIVFVDHIWNRLTGNIQALGVKQQTDIEAALNTGGALENVMALLVVSSQPLAVLDSETSVSVFNQFKAERDDVIKALLKWKKVRQTTGNRDVVMLSSLPSASGHYQVVEAEDPTDDKCDKCGRHSDTQRTTVPGTSEEAENGLEQISQVVIGSASVVDKPKRTPAKSSWRTKKPEAFLQQHGAPWKLHPINQMPDSADCSYHRLILTARPGPLLLETKTETESTADNVSETDGSPKSPKDEECPDSPVVEEESARPSESTAVKSPASQRVTAYEGHMGPALLKPAFSVEAVTVTEKRPLFSCIRSKKTATLCRVSTMNGRRLPTTLPAIRAQSVRS